MPELLEVEFYRHALDAVRGATITSVSAPDPIVRNGIAERQVVDALVGRTIKSATRHGKLLLVGEHDAPFLGLHFGMTGELIVDGKPAIDGLAYASKRRESAWTRFSFTTTKDHEIVFMDPRRLGRLVLEPLTDHLGPDAATLSTSELGEALRTRRALKAALLDQHRVAGLGNLLTDEALWRAGLSPHRDASHLHRDEIKRLHGAIKQTLRILGSRGGSHTGDTFALRSSGGPCPRCAHHMRRETVGGRTTWWCAGCQH